MFFQEFSVVFNDARPPGDSVCRAIRKLALRRLELS